MKLGQIVSHALTGCVAAGTAFFVAKSDLSVPTQALAQAPSGLRSTELFKQVMTDVMGRQFIVRLTERDPGNGSPAHRHPGAHTVGYILEGTYEVKIDDGPVRTLKPGEVFYEYPNALHAISRNPSTTAPLKYLVIQVYDPSKPATVNEHH
jgi:quercetin dioxygenase-like cupin family protein